MNTKNYFTHLFAQGWMYRFENFSINFDAHNCAPYITR
jgi:hypothetical protein